MKIHLEVAGSLLQVHQAGRFCLKDPYLNDSVKKLLKKLLKRREEVTQRTMAAKKKDMVVFWHPCADHCGGQWRQLHSHSSPRANVRDAAICHYTKPGLYLAGAILRKLWGFILQGLVSGGSYLKFSIKFKITHYILHSVLHLNGCLNRHRSIQNTQAKNADSKHIPAHF